MIADIERFVAEERRYWTELESMLDVYENSATHRMTLAEAQRFLYLYERCSASLARLTPMSVDAGLRSYVESLVARAYGEVHEVRRRGPRPEPVRWFFRTFPRVFRAHWRAFALSVALTMAGIIFGAGALATDPDSRSVLMPFPGLLQEPKERVAREQSVVRDKLSGRKSEFAAELMTHNTRVAIFTMSLGITFGAGTALVLFGNGLMLGAVAFDYIRAGQTTFLAGWLLPHGSIRDSGDPGCRTSRVRSRERADRLGLTADAQGTSAACRPRSGDAGGWNCSDARVGGSDRGLLLPVSRALCPLRVEDRVRRHRVACAYAVPEPVRAGRCLTNPIRFAS